MNTDPTADAGAAPADPLSDVNQTHMVTDSERAALAAADEVDAAANLHVIPGAAAPEAPAAAAPTTEAADAAAAGDAAAAAAAAAQAAPPAAAAGAEPQPQLPAPALQEVPPPPKDFAAEFNSIDARLEAARSQYDTGALDDAEFHALEKELRTAERALTVEQAKYEGQKTAIETQNALATQAAQAAAAADFTAASAAWAAANAEFMSNPIRAKAMQDMVNTIDLETGGKLPAEELLARAAKTAFEAYNYTPKPAAPAAAPAKPAAAALAARQPDMGGVPRTLGDAPTSGLDTPVTEFSHLDGASVIDMERAVAGMSEAQREAWLQEVDAPLT
jgi:hypothetical protein